ncbi:MAG: hypothetical protein RLN67_03210 [Algiphilus sp.]|uniref:hypothetical protein n=1 Tax=Algiphilus sp. TaxID=1872431 RepID=UPI0032EEEA70
MPRAGDNARKAADRLARTPKDATAAAEAGLRAAADEAVNVSVDITSGRYNLTPDTVRRYVGVHRVSAGGTSATVRLKVRAIPIEEFAPEIRMRRFSWVDRLGRRHTQMLPAVYFQRLRNRNPRYLRPAFPLQQRYSGQLREGGRIRRRVGEARDRLTNIRYFSFPRRFLREDLLPQVQERVVGQFDLEFRAAFRRLGRGGRRRLTNND